MNVLKSSEYIENERRAYALYVLQQRAIPLVMDGLKSSARRVLWTARGGNKIKTATLAGMTMPIHPHAEASSTINTLAAFYGNNIPLLTGYGSFGTILKPSAYGASRYTSVALSEFSKDVLFRDIEIIPMVENYDSTLMEPKHFLPLVPIALVNPTEGIAVGFATDILPRSLEDIIIGQLIQLKGKKGSEPMPHFFPTDNRAVSTIEKKESLAYVFHGMFKQTSASMVIVTKLPYGTVHEKYTNYLEKLIDAQKIVDYEDHSTKSIDIEIKFKRGQVNKLSNSQMMKLLGLIQSKTENLTIVNFDGETIWKPTAAELIAAFTTWRLQYYVARYERLHSLCNEEIQKLKDILLAIKKKVGMIATKTTNRAELKEFLKVIGIVNLDFIADLPVYRFTQEERDKTQKKIDEAEERNAEYVRLLSSEEARKIVYMSELTEVLKRYNHGNYTPSV